MSKNGGIIGRLNIPTRLIASGVWGLREQLQLNRDGVWPLVDLSITNTTNLTSATDLSSYTFSGADLGTPTQTRHIIVAGTSIRAGNTGLLSSVTIGGVTATIVTEVSTNNGHSFIAIAKVTSGTTGDIVVTYGLTVENLQISVFAVQGSETVTSLDSFTSTGLTGSQSITTVNGGVLVAVRMSGGAGSALTLSWTDSSTAANGTITNINTQVYLSSYSKTLTTSETVSWSITGSPSTRTLVAASFQQ
jgi:hypothetical protein